MQGHLLKRFLEVEITTACAHCGQPMVIVVDSELSYRIERGGTKPLVFEPEVDWSRFQDPTIIDGY